MKDNALKTLVIDDCQTDGETLAYLLIRKLGCEVEIATDGLDGLNRLTDGNFDLLFLDVMMPFLSGIEVLAEIRQWSKTAQLPVIIISANTDSDTIRSLLELKIFDYIIKPYNADRLVKRLASKLGELKSRLFVPVSVLNSGEDAVVEPGREVILVVDGDANFRHFLATTLAARFHVLEAASGAQAIAASIKHSPQVLLAGSQIGLFGRDRMVAKLRAVSSLAAIKIYAVDADDEANAAEKSLYDGRVKRTFVPQIFAESFERCLGGIIADRAPFDNSESLRQHLISATEQVFSMMMSTEVSLEPQPAELAAAKPSTCAAIALLGFKESKRIKIEFRCDRACVVAMAMLMLQMDEQEPATSMDLARSTLAEALNIIGGRVNESLGDEGKEFILGLPCVEDRTGLDGSLELRQDFEMTFSFGEGIYFPWL
jgi:CheY-like chemotaxis protein